MSEKKARIAPAQDLLLFHEELLGVVRAGVPIASGLRMLAKETMHGGRFAAAVERAAERLEQGRTLSDALEAENGLYPPGWVSLLRVGERMESLGEVLETLVAQSRRRLRITATVRSALAYPLTVLALGSLIVTGLLLWVVPQFGEIYATAGAKLPAVTRVLLDVSNVFTGAGWIVLPLIAFIFLAVAWTVFGREPGGAEWRVLRHLPVLSRVEQYRCSAAFLSVCGMLLERGAATVDALRVTALALPSETACEQVLRVADHVEAGSALEREMNHLGFLAPTARSMIAGAVRREQLPRTMRETANFYDERVAALEGDLGRLLEPFLLLVLGALMGLTLAGLYLPLFRLGTAVM